ncbi:MAG: 3-isopropylmalate dehydratase small subunit [Deltaproteobacteria bacterium]|jgi:3-isopropylmalate/(R)-2-methylmalate dehydratase small subunit|nr:3-isopropylmalate dehydratase small subunit [Deltaproteobacteria bacterium]
MESFKRFTALAAYLDRPNVDTDLIIPKQFLKRISRDGYGQFLFNDLRFLPSGEENLEFSLNFPRFKGAGVLVSGRNFGCGSSREHAAWALMDYGFKTVIAESFGDIFSHNSSKVGLLLVERPLAEVKDLMGRIEANTGYTLTVDLEGQEILGSDGYSCHFNVDPKVKAMFLKGADDIDYTLSHFLPQVALFEKEHKAPWQAVLPEKK